MNITNTLILLAVIAWILQIILGWRQISRFNKAFEQLCRLGNVGIGRTAGRFRPKVVIAVAFDENQCVTGSLLMKGYTVFSRPAAISRLQGMQYQDIVPMAIFPHSPACREALEQALRLQ